MLLLNKILFKLYVTILCTWNFSLHYSFERQRCHCIFIIVIILPYIYIEANQTQFFLYAASSSGSPKATPILWLGKTTFLRIAITFNAFPSSLCVWQAFSFKKMSLLFIWMPMGMYNHHFKVIMVEHIKSFILPGVHRKDIHQIPRFQFIDTILCIKISFW